MEDAEQLPLSIRLFHKKAFTLIELLVVVLIIGILAAVALPQYQKAVKKAQGREVIVAINTLDKALAAYALEHGRVCDLPDDVNPYPCTKPKLDIEIPDTTYFERTGIGVDDVSAPVSIFRSRTADATVIVDRDYTTGNRISTTCTGRDCPAYFGGDCSTSTIHTCNGDPIENPASCPPHYVTPDIERTTCELDI